ncbi:hypothetical protein J6590_102448 [Homalodisca vitripennis]|nr:hypothetical protein J6590_003554 [Homalodisca vitripennis]KAG8324010.1 hypothetical protein J6590_102448 [Homalodisca vitripennis]
MLFCIHVFYLCKLVIFIKYKIDSKKDRYAKIKERQEGGRAGKGYLMTVLFPFHLTLNSLTKSVRVLFLLGYHYYAQLAVRSLANRAWFLLTMTHITQRPPTALSHNAARKRFILRSVPRLPLIETGCIIMSL